MAEMGEANEVVDGVELLLRFHAQVRGCLQRLHAIREAVLSRDVDSVQDAVREAGEVVRFLELRTPLHERDEAESLFPRLSFALRRAGESETEVAVQIARAEDEHADFQAVWVPLQHWLWQLSTPDAIVSVDRFCKAIDAIEEHFEHHFSGEEDVIYAAARRLLTEGELSTMAAEIRSRHVC